MIYFDDYRYMLKHSIQSINKSMNIWTKNNREKNHTEMIYVHEAFTVLKSHIALKGVL